YTVYQGTFYGKDGVIGVTAQAAAQPASILSKGEVAVDFPKENDSWYQAEGTTGTGSLSDGTALNFKVPAEVFN
ncbi:MAG TPA: hypothetical protein VEA58_06390, partial [Anaerovoracaceae bacterium]|nr:hypothetical protein [Anaerovoracaceae bacterium]